MIEIIENYRKEEEKSRILIESVWRNRNFSPLFPCNIKKCDQKSDVNHLSLKCIDQKDHHDEIENNSNFNLLIYKMKFSFSVIFENVVKP